MMSRFLNLLVETIGGVSSSGIGAQYLPFKSVLICFLSVGCRFGVPPSGSSLLISGWVSVFIVGQVFGRASFKMSDLSN